MKSHTHDSYVSDPHKLGGLDVIFVLFGLLEGFELVQSFHLGEIRELLGSMSRNTMGKMKLLTYSQRPC
jgi:hypothetical protein